jgi:putative ABC transport system ATP-binding protein
VDLRGPGPADKLPAMSAPVTVSFDGVYKTFTRGEQPITVLDNVTLEVPNGDFVALMGPSGSGKSSLLNLVAGLDKPTRGRVVVGDVDPATLTDNSLADWRSRTVGFIFQRYHLLGALTAAENVEVPLLLFGLSSKERAQRVRTALELVGLQDRMGHFPKQLSGGQEQRVAIARAIVTDPSLLLADEPTGDLDSKSGDEILDLLVQLNGDLGKSIIMVTHDPKAAKRAKRTFHLEKGFVYEDDAAAAAAH